MPSKDRSGGSIPQRANDVIEAISAIAIFFKGVDRAAFAKDLKTQSAVERKLLTVSEACTKISEIETRSGVPTEKRLAVRFPEIPWSRIRGIGNVIRHEYGRVDVASIWDTVTGEDLSQLRAAVETIAAEPDP